MSRCSISKTLAWLAVYVVVITFSTSSTSVQACSCIRRTFRQLYQDSPIVQTIYVMGQVQLDEQGRFNGWVDPDAEDAAGKDYPGNIYYLVYNKKTHKGKCSGRKQYQLVQTSGSSASCGVLLEIGTWYLLGSAPDNTNNPKFFQVNSCGLYRPLSSVPTADWNYVKTHTTVCNKKE